MVLRRAFYHWMFPAAFLLPLWMFAGGVIFGHGAGAVLWVIIAIPSLFVGQLVLTLLLRARPSARRTQAVSWWDLGGFTTWHLLTIAIGFFPTGWGYLLLLAIAAGVALFWLMLWQLWDEARGTLRTVSTAGGASAVFSHEPSAPDRGVFVVHESIQGDGEPRST